MKNESCTSNTAQHCPWWQSCCLKDSKKQNKSNSAALLNFAASTFNLVVSTSINIIVWISSVFIDILGGAYLIVQQHPHQIMLPATQHAHFIILLSNLH